MRPGGLAVSYVSLCASRAVGTAARLVGFAYRAVGGEAYLVCVAEKGREAEVTRLRRVVEDGFRGALDCRRCSGGHADADVVIDWLYELRRSILYSLLKTTGGVGTVTCCGNSSRNSGDGCQWQIRWRSAATQKSGVAGHWQLSSRLPYCDVLIGIARSLIVIGCYFLD